MSLPPAALPVVSKQIVCPAPAKPASSGGAAAWPSGALLTQISGAWKTEWAEVEAAVGNPDTGADSPAWKAFKTALTSGDASAIKSSAETVLTHLARACDAVAPYFDLRGAEAWAAETRALLEGMAGAIVEVRDAGMAGSPAGVEAGWSHYQIVMVDHFLQSIKGNAPETNRWTMQDGRTVTASRVRFADPAGNALDGSVRTAWIAGGAPAPQWIEIDLGWQSELKGIRLLTSQDAAGRTDHVVTYGSTRGDEHQMTRFTGQTSDQQWLELAPSTPIAGVRFVRVTTLETPSTVGWREIELITSEKPKPTPCPSAASPVTGLSALLGEPSTAANQPAFAVDGNESTGWDPGELRPGNVRGWLRLGWSKPAQVSGIRVLLGPGPANARYRVTWWTDDGRSLEPAYLAPVTGQGNWATAPGPTPCLGVRMVDISVESAAPAGQIREVQVFGGPVRT